MCVRNEIRLPERRLVEYFTSAADQMEENGPLTKSTNKWDKKVR